MDKRCKLVMLPSNEKALLYKAPAGTLFKLDKPRDAFDGKVGQHFHLYITSEDEIKKERLRWIIDKREGMNNFIHEVSVILDSKLCPEILATTDNSLKVNTDYKGRKTKDETKITYSEPLPQPSQSFIEKYIEEYNKGNQIEDVMVEYDEYTETNYKHGIDSSEYICIPKVSSDNTITIRKIKDSWTKEEVIELLYRHTEMMIAGYRGSLNDWINQNL